MKKIFWFLTEDNRLEKLYYYIIRQLNLLFVKVPLRILSPGTALDPWLWYKNDRWDFQMWYLADGIAASIKQIKSGQVVWFATTGEIEEEVSGQKSERLENNFQGWFTDFSFLLFTFFNWFGFNCLLKNGDRLAAYQSGRFCVFRRYYFYLRRLAKSSGMHTQITLI